MRFPCSVPDSIAPYRISWYDVGAGKLAVFITLGFLISVSLSCPGDIDMYLGYWYCSFAACLSIGFSPSGAERLASYIILLGCAVLWYGYTQLFRTTTARARHSCHFDRCLKSFDSQFSLYCIPTATYIVLSARMTAGGMRLTMRRRRRRRKVSHPSWWTVCSRTLICGLLGWLGNSV